MQNFFTENFSSLEEVKDYISEQQTEFELILENIKAGLIVIDPDEKYVYFNDEAKRQMQIDGPMLGKQAKSCHPPAKYKQAKAIIQSFKRGIRDSFNREAEFFGKTYAIYVSAIRNEVGKYLGAVRVSVDISERKKLEKNLLRTKEKYENLFENSGEAILIVDIKSKKVEKLNQRAIDLYKYNSEDDLIGKDIRELVNRKEEEIAADMEMVINQGVYTFVSEHKCKDGEILDVEVHSRVINYNGKECFLYNVRDITSRLKVQKQKLKNQRLKQKYRLFRKMNDLYKGFAKIENKSQFKVFLQKMLNDLLMLSNSKQGVVLLKDFFAGEGYLIESNLNETKKVYENIITFFNKTVDDKYKQMVKNKEIMVSNQFNDEDNLAQTLGLQKIDCILGGAIIDENTGGEIGGIGLFNKSGDYKEVDKEVVITYMAQLKNAMRRVKSFKNQIEEERMKKELEIASQIQTSFLPDKEPDCDELEIAVHSQPAREVGGDYFGFNETEKELGILISDVMGKGIPAAIMVATIHSSFNTLVKFDQTPSKILKDLNTNLYADLKDSPIFVSAFYGLFDFENRTLKYSNAAHNPPIFWSSSQQKMSLLPKTGILCGIEPEYNYSIKEVNLQKGDIIIFYTDGLTDVRNSKEERFKTEKIEEIIEIHNYLSAQNLKEKIIEEINLFSQYSTYPDDVSFIICKFIGEGE